MGWKNLTDIRGWRRRRRERFAGYGLELEDEVEQLLTRMKEAGEISGFTRHEHHSDEDLSGRDFTVIRTVDGAPVERSFGVTISKASHTRARVRYFGTRQFHFPMGTKPETIRRRIQELFEEE